MNDIEKLMARLPRPSPSPDLDARIAELTRQPVRVVPTRARTRWFGAIAACSACAGLVGFVLGRQSTGPVAAIHADADSPAPAVPIVGSLAGYAVVNVQVPQNEALTRFVMPPKQFESLFGRGPLAERSGPSQLQ